MRCETFLIRLETLDARSEADRAMRRHLESCPACRSAFESLGAAIQTLQPEKSYMPPELALELEHRIMAAVKLVPQPRRELFSIRDWIIAGSVILASMALIPLGSDFGKFIEVVGTSYALPLALVLGLGITIYSALFVGTHVDAVMSFVRRRIVRQL